MDLKPNRNGPRNLEETVGRLVASGVECVLVVPSIRAEIRGWDQAALEEIFADQAELHSEVEFVFVSSSMNSESQAQLLVQALQAEEAVDPEGRTMPLSMLPPRQRGTINRLKGNNQFISRLAALGFIPGSPVEVVQNFGVGPLIVSVRGARLALGREEARKVRVCTSKQCARHRRFKRNRRHRPHKRGGHIE